jgi:glucokinase
LVNAYLDQDPWATYIWLDSLRKLAIALGSLINVFSPDAIALSGGMVLAGDALFKPLQAFIDIYEFNPFDKPTPVLRSKFDDLAGAIGAAAFSLSKI